MNQTNLNTTIRQNRAAKSKFMERGLISDLIIDPWLFNKVTRIVRAEMFQDIVYKTIFKVIEQMLVDGYAVDETVLINKTIEYIENIQKNKHYTKDQKETLAFFLDIQKFQIFILDLIDREHEPNEDDAKAKAKAIKENWMSRKSEKMFLESSKRIVQGKNIYSVLDYVKSQIEKLEQEESLGEYKMEQIGDEFLAIVKERMLNPQNNIIPSGFKTLDKAAPLTFDEFHVIGARPGMGKTAIMLIHALAAAKSNYPVRIFSLEMSKYKLVSRFCQYLTNINSRSINNGKINNISFENVKIVIEILKQLNIHIIDDIYSIEGIWSYLKAEFFKNGLIMGDYLQLGRTIKKVGNKDLEIAEITSSSKKIAKSLESCVLWLSQLSREVEKRKEKRPIISDLLYSGGIDRDADVIRMLYREEYYLPESKKITSSHLLGTGEDIIRKNREGELSTLEYEFKNGKWISDYIDDLFELKLLKKGDTNESEIEHLIDDLPF